MKTLKEIHEGFFDNVGSMSPTLWLSKLKYTKLHGSRLTKEYLYKIDGPKLILMHDNDKCVFDFAKGLLWTSFVKFCDPSDEYIFTFEPAYGQIWFKLWSRKGSVNRPSVYITFNKDMSVYQMSIDNKELLGIDDKFYKSKGYTAGEYINDRELIKYIIR